jgi:divalent metal cation (Fe/Co/Zn/Cd) transporter
MLSTLVNQSAEKHLVARKSTFVSIALNTVLMALQIVIGVTAHSQALIADGVHSLADLVSDFVVLIANRHSGAEPDADHNYGHSRYEHVLIRKCRYYRRHVTNALFLQRCVRL